MFVVNAEANAACVFVQQHEDSAGTRDIGHHPEAVRDALGFASSLHGGARMHAPMQARVVSECWLFFVAGDRGELARN